MFDPDDPRLARVRELALALPEARQKVSHGRPAFFTTKVFAYYGGSRKVDGEWVQHPHLLVVQPSPDERAALLGDPRCYLPAYLAGAGWIGVELPAPGARAGHWGEVAELLDASFRVTAPARLVSVLDDRDR